MIAGHRAHLSELLYYLPYLLLLACPLPHLFMHRGRGGHGRNHDHGQGEKGDKRE
ncbi:MAG: DUF2933 domain-containing protein [Betaproteobacteria bacterium]|nr:DUF2933 domain-containing protein [Betaproteobacteria bacterium]